MGRDARGREYVDGLVVISFEDRIEREKAADILASYGLNMKSWWEEMGTATAEVPAGKEEEWRHRLDGADGVFGVSLNYITDIHD